MDMKAKHVNFDTYVRVHACLCVCSGVWALVFECLSVGILAFECVASLRVYLCRWLCVCVGGWVGARCSCESVWVHGKPEFPALQMGLENS